MRPLPPLYSYCLKPGEQPGVAPQKAPFLQFPRGTFQALDDDSPLWMVDYEGKAILQDLRHTDYSRVPLFTLTASQDHWGCAATYSDWRALEVGEMARLFRTCIRERVLSCIQDARREGCRVNQIYLPFRNPPVLRVRTFSTGHVSWTAETVLGLACMVSPDPRGTLKFFDPPEESIKVPNLDGLSDAEQTEHLTAALRCCLGM